MVKRITKILGHVIQAILAYTAYGFFSLWPLDKASAIGGWIGRTLGPRMSVSKRAYKHLELALPELSRAEHTVIVRDMWDNIARNIAETPHLKKLVKLDRLHLVGLEHVHAALAKGKGVLIASGHFANWEVGPIIMWKHGLPMTTVYRRPNNLFVDRLLRRVRRWVTPNLLVKGKEAAPGIVRTLRQNGPVGVLIDQKMNYGGAPLQFFGQPAMTGLATGQLALKTGAPLLTATCTRNGGADFSLIIHPPIEISGERIQTDEKAADMMQQVNDIFEQHIRAYPGQWLWLHRRWSSKRKPWDTPDAHQTPLQ